MTRIGGRFGRRIQLSSAKHAAPSGQRSAVRVDIARIEMISNGPIEYHRRHIYLLQSIVALLVFCVGLFVFLVGQSSLYGSSTAIAEQRAARLYDEQEQISKSYTATLAHQTRYRFHNFNHTNQ